MPKNTSDAAKTVGYTAAVQGDKPKYDLYLGKYNIAKDRIIPFAVETTGYISPVGFGFLQNIVKQHYTAGQRVDSASYSKTWRWVLETLSVTLARGNAFMLRAYLDYHWARQNRTATHQNRAVGASASASASGSGSSSRQGPSR